LFQSNSVIRRITIRFILIIGLLISGLIPTSVVIYISYRTTHAELKDQVFRQLESVRNIKKEQINNFFNERIANISAFSENPTILQAFHQFKNVFDYDEKKFKGYSDEKFEAPQSYLIIHDRYFAFLKSLVLHYGYYDLFLLEPENGYTIFTVRKEPDFGIRISKVPSSLRDVWMTAVKEKRVAVSDTRPYPLSNNIPAQFIAAPLVENEEVKGVIAVQVSIDSIDNIMKERSGMWRTGETYLVGKDKKMRSDSYLDSESHSVRASFWGTVRENGVDTVASREALQGFEDRKIIIDYRGKRVLSAYTPVNIRGVEWALIAEVDEEEINNQIAQVMNVKIIILTTFSVLLLFLLALSISAYVHKEIRKLLLYLEKIIDDILSGKLHARVNPKTLGVDFQSVMARTNDLLDAFVKQMKEKRELEDHIQTTQRLEAIGTLAGGIAHDFNNILTSMHAYASIVKANIPKDGVAEENIEELILSIRRASELIEQILTFSRQVKAEEKYLDISEEILESIRLFKAALPRNIQVESHLYSEPLMIRCNPSQIRQVIMNIYTNAYQAMQKKGGTLTISTDRIQMKGGNVPNLKKGSYCRISIKDTGHGMDKNIQKRIFEPFFTTKPLGEGTGMGLSVVHGIVQKCGGAIEVSSSPGMGSNFEVYFPLASEVFSDDRKDDLIRSVIKGKGHILFVDDDVQLCDSQKKALELLGYDVTAIYDSRVCEEDFSRKSDEFDLIIVDLNMPHLDGFALSKRILDIRPDIPIILTTGYAEMVNKQKIKELGFQSLLMKPYGIDALSQLISEILKSKKKRGN
jgi:signal transduction histidine kinase/ActR/RegA family two-component response regulator